jgi:hypothetical protein
MIAMDTTPNNPLSDIFCPSLFHVPVKPILYTVCFANLIISDLSACKGFKSSFQLVMIDIDNEIIP